MRKDYFVFQNKYLQIFRQHNKIALIELVLSDIIHLT